MELGRDCDPWICSQTHICCQTRYRLRYQARYFFIPLRNQMLLKVVLNMKPKPVLKVKKEPWISKSQNDSLPTLPVVIPQGTTRKSEQVLSDSESKPKKARTS